MPRRRAKKPPAVSAAQKAAWALQWPEKAAQGWYLDSGGYVARMERVNGKRIYVREHRLVAERMLGRPLRKGENCHHRNGVRHDNRPENIEIWVTSQPAGQRPEDLLAWAHEVIRLYGGDASTVVL